MGIRCLLAFERLGILSVPCGMVESGKSHSHLVEAHRRVGVAFFSKRGQFAFLFPPSPDRDVV